MLAPSLVSSRSNHQYFSQYEFSKYVKQFQEIIDSIVTADKWLPAYAQFAREWNKRNPTKKIPTGTSWPDSVFWVYGIKRDLESLEELFSIKLHLGRQWTITIIEGNTWVTDEGVLSEEDNELALEASRREAIEREKWNVQIITDAILNEKVTPKERKTYSEFEQYFRTQFWEEWEDFIPKIIELEFDETRGSYRILQKYRERMSKISESKKYRKVIDLIFDFELLTA